MNQGPRGDGALGAVPSAQPFGLSLGRGRCSEPLPVGLVKAGAGDGGGKDTVPFIFLAPAKLRRMPPTPQSMQSPTPVAVPWLPAGSREECWKTQLLPCNLLSEALHGSLGRGREPFQIATGEGRCQSCAGWGTCPCCSCASLSASRGRWEGQRALRKCRPAFTPTHQSLVTGKSKCKWNHGTIPRIHCRAS